MFKKKKQLRTEFDKWGLLSSIWILVSNDENPIITYKGLIDRLGLNENYDIKGLIKERSDLFRRTVPQSHLSEWKEEMKKGKNLPSWISILKGDYKTQAIDGLAVGDVFRSQFRIEKNAPKSDIKIIEWGLGHIDRLRNAESDKSKQKITKFSSVWIPIFSTIITVIALTSSFFIQYKGIVSQQDLKQYEVEYKPKIAAYSNFMKYTMQCYSHALEKDRSSFIESSDLLETTFYEIEPFLSIDEKEIIWKRLQDFISDCYSVVCNTNDNMRLDDISLLLSHKLYFKENLYKQLFTKNK